MIRAAQIIHAPLGKRKAASDAGSANRPAARGSGFPPFVQWVYEVYRDQPRLPETEGSRKYHTFIESSSLETFPLSGARRVQSFHIIKFGYPMRRAGYITAAFTARVFAQGSTSRQHEAYFAYAYWPRSSGREAAPPEYICLSPTFESRDGEYRHRFLWFKQFLEGYAEASSILAPIEEALLEAISEDVLGIDLLFFPVDGENRGILTAPIAYADSERLGIKALAAALAIDALQARTGTLQIHASPAYMAVVRTLYDRCAGIFGAWDQSVRDRLSVFGTGKAGQPNRTQCGQKLIPLTVRESLQVNDINFAPWREVWIGKAATDLVVNGVASMFPIYNNWTYLDGVDQSLFENKPMHERYARSLQAEGVHASPRLARAGIREAAKTIAWASSMPTCTTQSPTPKTLFCCRTSCCVPRVSILGRQSGHCRMSSGAPQTSRPPIFGCTLTPPSKLGISSISVTAPICSIRA